MLGVATDAANLLTLSLAVGPSSPPSNVVDGSTMTTKAWSMLSALRPSSAASWLSLSMPGQNLAGMRGSTDDNWLSLSTPAEFCYRKRVTLSDTNPNQHRFQLSVADIRKSARPLQELAEEARRLDVGVPVRVVDRKGNSHGMSFKYLGSAKAYRLSGKGYTKFLADTELKAEQVMAIWSLPRGRHGERCLAFINNTEEN